jgi:hypothetical protein
MGLFWRGIPHFIFPAIKRVLEPSFVAVETGTYKGQTTKKLSKLANSVTTIEADFAYYQRSKKILQRFDNVTVLHGDSGRLIESTLPSTQINCLIWLDAHYSGGNTAGAQHHCPLLSELQHILSSRRASNTIVLIDDSRGLIGKSGWPMLSELVVLLSQSGFSSIVIDDVLISSSNESLGKIADDFSQSRTSTFERLGGRMLLVAGLVKTLGIATGTAFKIKHSNLLLKK